MRIEKRSGVVVLIYGDGSCHPASGAEVKLYRRAEKADAARKVWETAARTWCPPEVAEMYARAALGGGK